MQEEAGAQQEGEHVRPLTRRRKEPSEEPRGRRRIAKAARAHVGVVVHRGNQVLDQRLQGRRHQAVVMVTHLAVARRDGGSVNPASGGDRAAATRLLAAAAAAAAVAVGPRRTGSAVLPRRGVRVVRHRTVAAVVALPRRRRAALEGGVGLRQVVGVLGRAVGAAGDALLGGVVGVAAVVRTVGLRTVAVGVGGELASIRGCGRHDHLWRGRRSGRQSAPFRGNFTQNRPDSPGTNAALIFTADSQGLSHLFWPQSCCENL